MYTPRSAATATRKTCSTRCRRAKNCTSASAITSTSAVSMRCSCAKRAERKAMRAIFVLANVCACVGAFAGARDAMAEQGAEVALVEQAAKQCALHLTLPANWTLEEAREQDACVVTAREPV